MKVETGSLENAKYDYFRKIDEARYAGEAIAVVEAFIQEAERAIGRRIRRLIPIWTGRSNIFGTITPIPSHSLESPGSFTSTLRICRVISPHIMEKVSVSTSIKFGWKSHGVAHDNGTYDFRNQRQRGLFGSELLHQGVQEADRHLPEPVSETRRAGDTGIMIGQAINKLRKQGLFLKLFLVTLISIVTVSLLTLSITISMSEKLFLQTFSITNGKLLNQMKSNLSPIITL